MSIAFLSSFLYEGGPKISEIEITNPIEYNTSIRAKDLNDISKELNGLIAAINDHEEQIYNLKFSNIIDLSQFVTSIKLNNNTYMPSAGLINLGTISAGTIGINNITVNGSTSGVSISGNTANITIDIPELPTIETTLTESSTNSTVAGSKAVVNYVSSYVESQFISAGTHTHDNKDILDNITDAEMNKLSGIEAGAQVNVIDSITVNGSTSNVTITDKTANIAIDIPELPTIETTLTETSTNSTVAGSKAVIDYVSSYVSGKIEDLNNFDGNYDSLTDKPTISGQIITGEISSSIIPIVDSVISNNIMQTKTISDITGYTLEHNTFTKISNTVSSLTLNIAGSNIKAMCLLTTVSGTTEPTITFDYPDTYLINKDITFKNDTTYLIAAENDIILWTELVKFVK